MALVTINGVETNREEITITGIEAERFADDILSRFKTWIFVSFESVFLFTIILIWLLAPSKFPLVLLVCGPLGLIFGLIWIETIIKVKKIKEDGYAECYLYTDTKCDAQNGVFTLGIRNVVCTTVYNVERLSELNNDYRVLVHKASKQNVPYAFIKQK